ncbi:MAG: MMPL family transporter, partial [Desulfobacterales bacterium]|nr:MMPL family transporter [Desulfobacterales bacterium]
MFGLFRINIDADIVESLPKNDPVVSDAVYFFDKHPMLDQLIIDLGLKRAAPDMLVECGALVEDELMNSGLFRQVGISDFRKLIPELIAHILDNLPALFTERDLSEKIGPLLEPGAIKEKLDNIYSSLHNLEGIGQGEFIASDPLGLRDLVLSRLAHLAPGRNVKFHGENLLSSDSRHLLVIANPIMSGTDTAFARKVTALMDQVRSRIEQRYAKSGYEFILTPVGAYRSALDNETTIRRDVKKAILFATLGIILLLLLAFPRPLLGVLSLVPALLGVMSAFFVYSLFHQSISVMVLGFGGAIISITVDHGIAYLLFLDRPLQTSGKEASREVWSVGLIAVLTSVGAFGALVMSGFPVLEQLGKFTALGIAFSFLFVHTLFPAVFRETRPAAPRRRPLQGLVNKFASTGKIGACCACVFFLVMVFFAKPEFNVKLSAMNTVSKDTIEAEKLITNVWGNIFDKVYLMTEGKSVETLQSKSDQQLALMEEDFASDRISSGFVPSMIFPGTKQRKQNFMAWKNFWTRARVAALKRNVKEISLDLGFATGAFAPFFSRIGRDVYLPEESGIPDRFFTLAGIREKDDGLTFVHVSGLTVGASYEADRFFNKYGTLGRIFDQAYFSQRLGRLLFSTFTRMLVLIVICVAALLFFFFFDLRLTGAALLPISFAMISTLGTLKLIGHPLDISGLMLSIIVIGMGVDYSIFFVRSYQRYGNAFDPLFGLIRMAVFMAAVSTLIGFGILCFAEHSLLRSAGLTCLFGIGYSLIGAFILLPPVLDRIFKQREKPGKARGTVNERVLNRYRNLES